MQLKDQDIDSKNAKELKSFQYVVMDCNDLNSIREQKGITNVTCKEENEIELIAKQIAVTTRMVH